MAVPVYTRVIFWLTIATVFSVSFAELRCYSCTSYMSQCTQKVDDSQGDVFKTNCRTKCFVRQGEDGAIYRGCFDGFEEVTDLTSSYTGCRNQTWNRQSLPWCLCKDDLCNVDAYDLMQQQKPTYAYAYNYNYDFVNNVNYNQDNYNIKAAKDAGRSNDKAEMDNFAKEASEDKHYDETLFGFNKEQDSRRTTGRGQSSGSSDRDKTYRNAANYEQNYYRQEPRGYDYVYYGGTQDRQQKATGNSGSNVAEKSRDSGSNYNTAAYYNNAVNGGQGVYDYDYYVPENYVRDAYYQYNYGGVPGAAPYQYAAGGDKYDSAVYGDLPYYTQSSQYPYNYVSPQLATKIRCAQTGYYQNPSDCRQFVACLVDPHSRTPVMHVMKCPDGLVWDNRKKICMEYSTTCNVGGSSSSADFPAKGPYDGTVGSETYRLNVDGYQSNVEHVGADPGEYSPLDYQAANSAYQVADVSSLFKDVVYSDADVQPLPIQDDDVKLDDGDEDEEKKE